MKSLLSKYLALLALLVLAYFVYLPGLSGGFIFDDFVNLNAIGATGPVDNWQTFLRYVTSGTADPTGRPLAMATFLIDARDWPADPRAFLTTNVLIHLLNGVLLFKLIESLGEWVGDSPRKGSWNALLAAGIWLLHPLWVSTTLYAVQREAMLPATFTILGLLAFLRGRHQWMQSNGDSGAPWMIMGIMGGTILAILSKANGILLPILALVLESTVVAFKQNSTRGRELGLLGWVLLRVPTLVVLGYLLSFLPTMHADLGVREWNIAQRILSEPRAICTYLALLAIPRSVSSGVYNDGFEPSLGLFDPATTGASLLFLVAIPFLAWRFRRSYPAACASILFFLAGHLLESTTVPLELFFEHRNYLPAILLFWPLARWISAVRVRVAIRVASACLILALMAVTTLQRTELWGNPSALSAISAQTNPQSSRAQVAAGMSLINAGQPARALEILEPMWDERPQDLQLALNVVSAKCAGPGLSARDVERVAQTLHQASTGLRLVHNWLTNMIEASRTNLCAGLTLPAAGIWVEAFQSNPAVTSDPGNAQDVEPLLAKLAIARHQPLVALEHFNRAFVAFPTPDVVARNVAYLASNGEYQRAIDHLDYFEANQSLLRKPGLGMPIIHSYVLEQQHYWPREFAVLRMKLIESIAADKKPTTTK